jgi:WD40 repeat protein
MPRSVIASVALFVLFVGNASGQQPASWLYLSAIRSGKLLLWDVNADKLVREIPVEDSSGSIGVAVSSDGKRLFVVDGNEVGHLKIYDTITNRLAAEHTFQNRELSNGGSVVHLTPDDRYLFVNTYDYGEAASGVRVFDVNTDAFLKLGLRARQCVRRYWRALGMELSSPSVHVSFTSLGLWAALLPTLPLISMYPVPWINLQPWLFLPTAVSF